MKAILLCLFSYLFLPLTSFEQPVKKLGYVPAVATIDTTLAAKVKTIQCQVVKITNQSKQSRVMLVLVETSLLENEGRTKMRLNYMLKRERVYLKNIFVADIVVLETYRTIIDINALLQKLQSKYEGLQLWTVVDADALFSKTPQRLENFYSSHQ
jgi:hypothetical protein